MPADDSSDIPTSEDFRKRLDAVIDAARRRDMDSVTVQAGELHKMVGGYSNRGNHRMRACCRVMKGRMREGDRILSSPQSGYGASLLVLYLLKPHNASASNHG